MVAIKEVKASNARLNISPTALFIGATSGIGLSTAQQLLRQTASPTIYIVGRSQSSFQAKLDELRASNKAATVTFIEAQVSLLKDVERVCNEIEAKETKLDLLFLSAGYLSFDAREETLEGLTKHMVVGYYERMLSTHLLLPLLRASPSPRVISVLAAGKEGNVNTADLGLQKNENYNLLKSSDQQATMMSLAMEQLSKDNPTISFIHIYPGLVNTSVTANLFAGLKGWLLPLGWIVSWTVLPVLGLFGSSVEESGERGLYVATSGQYAVAGKAFHRLGWNGEECGENKVLETYRNEGLAQKVWKHTVGVFDKTLAA